MDPPAGVTGATAGVGCAKSAVPGDEIVGGATVGCGATSGSAAISGVARVCGETASEPLSSVAGAATPSPIGGVAASAAGTLARNPGASVGATAIITSAVGCSAVAGAPAPIDPSTLSKPIAAINTPANTPATCNHRLHPRRAAGGRCAATVAGSSVNERGGRSGSRSRSACTVARNSSYAWRSSASSPSLRSTARRSSALSWSSR